MSNATLRRKPRILFIGESNRSRTQMAEGYVRSLGAQYFDVQSAGMSSSRVDRRAIEVMSEDGVNIGAQKSKLISAELLTWADLVIVVEGEDEKFNAPVPSSASEKRWTVSCPVDRAKAENDLQPFREARDQIKRRVTQLVNSVRLFKR